MHYLIAWRYNLDADSVTQNRIGSGAKTGRLKQHYNPVKLYFLPGNGDEKQLMVCATSCQQPDIAGPGGRLGRRSNIPRVGYSCDSCMFETPSIYSSYHACPMPTTSPTLLPMCHH
jgi:hypothetical protein